jgi:serine/threonine protein kinase/tetratricopeptide (TPR) repeat protein
VSDEVDWDRVKNLVHQALTRPRDERVAFVSAACGNNQALRAEVVSLLAAHAEAGNFVERPALHAIDDWNGIAADSQAAEEPVLRPGDRIGPYRVQEPIGAGGMGQVYRAHDTKLERDVAIKILPKAFVLDPDRLARFEREAKTLASLNHPHICTIHEVLNAGDQTCIVMEYIDGRPLATMIPHQRGLPVEVVVRYGSQIADALAHAHQRRIVHRDLKAANVVITTEGRAKVLDFGLATRVVGRNPPDPLEPTVSRSPDAADIAGTIPYMAPEVLRGLPADPRSDIWGLGVVLHEMASGRRPFSGKSDYELTAAILNDPPAALPDRVPPPLAAIVQRCLAKQPTDRYQQAGEVRAALETAQLRPEPSSDRRHQPATWRTIAVGVIATALIAAVGWFGFHQRASAGGPASSLAVVPLASATGTAEADALSDGITESIINSLGQLPEARFKVIALSSVLRFKGRTIDPETVGRELGVGVLLTLRIVPQPNALSIGAQLVSTRDGSLMWGETYQTTLAGVFGTEEDIARKTIQHLRIAVTGEEGRRVTKRYTENTEAYQLYLRGRYYANRQLGSGANYQRGLDYFRQAIEEDRTYALAYTGVAYCYIGMGFEGWLPPQEALAKANAALATARALDPAIVDASVVSASVKNLEWDFAGAGNAYRRAITLNPNDAILHKYYSQYWRALGRWDAAIGECRRAQELDPLSLDTNMTLGTTYLWAGQLDRAIDQFGKTLELEPNSAELHELLADAYARKRMQKEAIEELRQALTLSGSEPLAIALVADYVSSGYEAVMKNFRRAQLAAVTEASKVRYVSPMEFATLYASLGDRDQAFNWIEKAFDEHSPWLFFLKTDPAFDTLRDDPRFDRLLRRVGVPA